MTLEEDHKKGRANIQEHVNIREKIIECYEKNLSAPAAARETGYNIKTVYEHYDDISQILLDSKHRVLVMQKNREAAQLIASHERLILKLHQTLDIAFDQMSNMNKEGKSIPKNIIGDITKIIKYIAELDEKKYNLNLDIKTEDPDVFKPAFTPSGLEHFFKK
jgi:hypothetical protein